MQLRADFDQAPTDFRSLIDYQAVYCQTEFVQIDTEAGAEISLLVQVDEFCMYFFEFVTSSSRRLLYPWSVPVAKRLSVPRREKGIARTRRDCPTHG